MDGLQLREYLAISAGMAVAGYYCLAWLQAGRDPKKGIIVTRYDPPRGYSPAVLRYVWKRRFDDRVFWAALLSLVAKGRVTLETSDPGTLVRPLERAGKKPDELPKEERILLERALIRKRGKPVPMTLLDSRTALAASQMAEAIRLEVHGNFLSMNWRYVAAGIALSAFAITIAAWPASLEHWVGLLITMGLIAPASFYLPFLILRMNDLWRALQRGVSGILVRRMVSLVLIAIPCVTAVCFGIFLLVVNFGWLVVLMTLLMVVLNLVFLEWMKAPTKSGRALLDEIEGFRHFLLSVEQLPKDLAEGPKVDIDSYERYLPYAIALEVEQQWSDQFIALVSTAQHRAFEVYAHSYYLGMWNGKPVEVAVGPEPRRRW
ncbi:MAG: hypothetical protein AB7O65_13920 [Candidatus Korobacteraceae bacterium]